MTTRRLVVIAAILVAGCATGGQPSAPATAGTAGDPRPAEARRCSATDPDRFAWFCVIGQIVYGAISSLQPDAGLGLR